MTRSATWIEYGNVNRVVGDTSRSDSAAPTVISLNVEPGSYGSVTARFRCKSRGAEGNALASNPGCTAIARIAPVRGSSTIAVALLAPHFRTVSRRTASAFAWIVWSGVR